MFVKMENNFYPSVDYLILIGLENVNILVWFFTNLVILLALVNYFILLDIEHLIFHVC